MWILTDDGSQQYVWKIGEDKFCLIDTELSSFRSDDDATYDVFTDTVCIQDYPLDEIKTILRTYSYDGIEDVEAQYGEMANQIIAECIFEHYGTFGIEPLFTGPLDECKKYIEEYVSNDQKDI
jgi:hypothetical protein